MGIAGLQPGVIELTNSSVSNISMDQKGTVAIRALSGIDLVGRGDMIVSGNTMLLIVNSLVVALTATAAGLAKAGSAGEAAAVTSAVAAVSGSLPLLLNPLIRFGIIPDPTI